MSKLVSANQRHFRQSSFQILMSFKNILVLCLVSILSLSSCSFVPAGQGGYYQQGFGQAGVGPQNLPPGAIPAADGSGFWSPLQNTSIKRHTVQMGNETLHLNDAELAEFQKKHGQPSSFKEGPAIYVGPNGERLTAAQ